MVERKALATADAVAATKVMKSMFRDDNCYAVLGDWGTIFHLLRTMEQEGSASKVVFETLYAQRTTHDIDIAVSKDYVIRLEAADGAPRALKGKTPDKIGWRVKRFLVSDANPKGRRILVADQVEVKNRGTSFDIDVYSRLGQGPKVGDAHMPIERILDSAIELKIDGETVRVASIDVLYELKEGIPPEKKRPQDLLDIRILGELRKLA